MNVTSLLNTSGAAQAAVVRLPSDPAAVGSYQAGQRIVPVKTSSESRLQIRGRTPWDAGGYSLPLSLNLKHTQSSPASRPALYSEPPAGDSTGSASPKSPNHKSSDSHSSLSSYMTISSSDNSNQSRSHSRISSLSTVSEYQALDTFVSDTTPTGRTMSDRDSEMSCPTVVEVQLPQHSSIEDVSFDNDSSRHPERPRSPSDAVLARNRGLTGSASPIDTSLASSFHQANSSSTSTSRAHKRTVSAPEFPPFDTEKSRSHHFPVFGPMAEPTPPKSPQRDDGDESVDSDPSSPFLPAEQCLAHCLDADGQFRCLFIKDCTTGSQLRKAISHLFGRNKLCTKAIPSHIWVHLCRKHYQRSRYRSADYVKKQVDLVTRQIKRVQAWSDENLRTNRRGDGILQFWNLQARKREALRLQAQATSSSRKRRLDEDEDQPDEDDDEPAAAGGKQAKPVGTAIPEWLQDKLNQKYDTASMLDIVHQIDDWAKANNIRQMPDIEILPEIASEPRTKTTNRRTAGKGNTHRHTQSDTTSVAPASQAPKRPRTGASPFDMQFQSLVNRPATGLNQAYPYQMHNGFVSIPENQASPNIWSPASYGSNHVLPSPVPQRLSNTPLASNNNHNNGGKQAHSAQGANGGRQAYTAQGANGGRQSYTAQGANGGRQAYAAQGTNGGQQSYAAQGRSLHARSMSENPMLLGSSYRSYASQPSQGYHQQDLFTNYSPPTGYGLPPTYQGYSTNGNSESSNPQAYVFGSFTSGPPDLDPPRYSHARLQSAPSIHQTPMQRPASIPGGPPSLHSLPSMQNMGHGTAINYFANQHVGLPSAAKGDGYVDYTQQSGLRY